MKKINYLIILLTFFVFYSCNDDDSITVEKIDSYYYKYMHHPTRVMENSDTDNLVKFEYQGDDIIKRTGGMLPVNSSTGYNYKFTDILYEEISHENNQITIISKIDYENFRVAPNERVITLNNKGHMIKKRNNRTNENIIETTDYIYNSKNLLIQSITNKQYKYFNLTETADFYYNNKKNLDSVITILKDSDELLNKTKEVFSNYDNSPNPVKNLIIFEESFYRALSQNNYSKYEKKVFDAYDDLIRQDHRNWDFIYDENGMIQFNPF